MTDAEKKLLNLVGGDAVLQTVRIDGYNIKYLKAGSGPVLLMLNGLNMGWGQWYKNIAFFSKNYTVYAPNLPPEISKKDLKKLDILLFELARKFINLNKFSEFYVLGHSTGGWLSLKLKSLEKRIKKIAVVNPLGLTSVTPKFYKPLAIGFLAKLLSKTVMKPSQKSIDNFLTSVFYDKAALKAEFTNYFLEVLLKNGSLHPFLIINRIIGFRKIRTEFSLADKLSKIQTPTLMILSANDPIMSIKEANRVLENKQYDNITVYEFANTGHTPFLEQPDKFNVLVEEFFKSK